jgi:hypothetical protein
VGRANFAAALVAGELKAPAAAPPLRALATKCGVKGEPGAAAEFFEALLLGGPAATSDKNQKGDLGQFVARLLSQPEAQLT